MTYPTYVDYVDDALVYNSINTTDECIQLQKDLAELEKWSKVWQMEFNQQNPLLFWNIIEELKRRSFVCNNKKLTF